MPQIPYTRVQEANMNVPREDLANQFQGSVYRQLSNLGDIGMEFASSLLLKQRKEEATEFLNNSQREKALKVQEWQNTVPNKMDQETGNMPDGRSALKHFEEYTKSLDEEILKKSPGDMATGLYKNWSTEDTTKNMLVLENNRMERRDSYLKNQDNIRWSEESNNILRNPVPMEYSGDVGKYTDDLIAKEKSRQDDRVSTGSQNETMANINTYKFGNSVADASFRRSIGEGDFSTSLAILGTKLTPEIKKRVVAELASRGIRLAPGETGIDKLVGREKGAYGVSKYFSPDELERNINLTAIEIAKRFKKNSKDNSISWDNINGELANNTNLTDTQRASYLERVKLLASSLQDEGASSVLVQEKLIETALSNIVGKEAKQMAMATPQKQALDVSTLETRTKMIAENIKKLPGLTGMEKEVSGETILPRYRQQIISQYAKINREREEEGADFLLRNDDSYKVKADQLLREGRIDDLVEATENQLSELGVPSFKQKLLPESYLLSTASDLEKAVANAPSDNFKTLSQNIINLKNQFGNQFQKMYSELNRVNKNIPMEYLIAGDLYSMSGDQNALRGTLEKMYNRKTNEEILKKNNFKMSDLDTEVGGKMGELRAQLGKMYSTTRANEITKGYYQLLSSVSMHYLTKNPSADLGDVVNQAYKETIQNNLLVINNGEDASSAIVNRKIGVNEANLKSYLTSIDNGEVDIGDVDLLRVPQIREVVQNLRRTGDQQQIARDLVTGKLDNVALSNLRVIGVGGNNGVTLALKATDITSETIPLFDSKGYTKVIPYETINSTPVKESKFKKTINSLRGNLDKLLNSGRTPQSTNEYQFDYADRSLISFKMLGNAAEAGDAENVRDWAVQLKEDLKNVPDSPGKQKLIDAAQEFIKDMRNANKR